MRIQNLYCDAEGHSHFRDIEVDLSEPWLGGFLSKPQPASAIIFRELPPGAVLDWHNAPRRQYVIYLDGQLKTTASDGATRTLGRGEIMLIEDTVGKGHRVEVLDGAPFRAVFVAVQ
jgi:quercetin dioxygenase-like cupin family protein